MTGITSKTYFASNQQNATLFASLGKRTFYIPPIGMSVTNSTHFTLYRLQHQLYQSGSTIEWLLGDYFAGSTCVGFGSRHLGGKILFLLATS